jgi:hypothetical protein
MNKNTLKNRIKYFESSKKKTAETKPLAITRREPGWIDTSDLNSNEVSPDFFEFEKELADFRASNKTVEDYDEKKE